jgi:hypothetical protein
VRSHFRTGKTAVNTIYDLVQERFEREETRLPSFFRTDVSVAYRMAVSFGQLVFTAGMQNVTLSREATKRDCRLAGFADPRIAGAEGGLIVTCEIDHQPAIFLPNFGVRAEL